jgi:hypothetical protein
MVRLFVVAHGLPDFARFVVRTARMTDDEDLDREIKVLEESIARMSRRLDELRRRRSAHRMKRATTSGTLPSMPAVSERTRTNDDPPTTRRGRR